jgi:arsenate reductase
LLKEHGIEHTYREYTKEPLSAEELQDVLAMLDMSAKQVFRKRDAANKTLGLTGDEAEEVLIAHMAEHPTLLQRPIGLLDGRAELGRPVENLLRLVAAR